MSVEDLIEEIEIEFEYIETVLKELQGLYEDFLELLKFRHFFIHGYGFLIQWELLKPQIKKALESYPKFKRLCRLTFPHFEDKTTGLTR